MDYAEEAWSKYHESGKGNCTDGLIKKRNTDNSDKNKSIKKIRKGNSLAEEESKKIMQKIKKIKRINQYEHLLKINK